MWAGDNSFKEGEVSSKGKHHTLKAKKIAAMFWILAIAAFYNKKLQETHAYLQN